MTGRMCLVVNWGSVGSWSAVTVPAHDSRPSQCCTLIALVERLWLTRNSAFTPALTHSIGNEGSRDENGWSYLIPSCLPVCIVWQGWGPLSSPPTGAALTAAALPDPRPAFGSTFLCQQTVTQQSTRVGCVSSPAPDCQLLGDTSRLIYWTCQTANRLK